MSQMQPHKEEMSKEELQDRVVLLEERIGELAEIVKDLQGVTSILHGSAVLAGQIMGGILDKIAVLEEANAKV